MVQRARPGKAASHNSSGVFPKCLIAKWQEGVIGGGVPQEKDGFLLAGFPLMLLYNSKDSYGCLLPQAESSFQCLGL